MLERTLAFLNNIGPLEILLILLLVLLLFGGRKLPELARGLGRGLREFRNELKGIKDDVDREPEEGKPRDKKDNGSDSQGKDDKPAK